MKADCGYSFSEDRSGEITVQSENLLRTAITIVGAVLLLAGLMPGGARAAGDTVTELHYSFGNTSDSVVFDWNGQEQTIYYGPTAA